jgi:hypothetical protein
MNRKPGKASNRDRKISLMRKAQTRANCKYGIGGRPKMRPPPPITLPTKPFKP